jgi:hypothetical protein
MPPSTSPDVTEFKGKSAAIDRKLVEIGHLPAVNLRLGLRRQAIEATQDRNVFPVQGPGSFVGFPSFYMQPDKTPPILTVFHSHTLPTQLHEM